MFLDFWIPLTDSFRDLTRTIEGSCSVCLDYIVGVLREYKILSAEDPDDSFDDFASVINFITGATECDIIPLEAYMDYTMESTYTEEKRRFNEQTETEESKGNEDCEDDRCPICLADFEYDVSITELNCSHFYHSSCARAWFLNNWLCPMCRADIRYTTYRKRKEENRHLEAI